jgi:hypothetical protein
MRATPTIRSMSNTRRHPLWLALVAFLLPVLAGCGAPAASSSPPATAGPSPSPAGPTSTVPGPSPATPPVARAVPDLAADLHDAVDPVAMLADLNRLEAITAESGGTRATGSDGYAAAARWIADELRALGYEVTLDTLTVPMFEEPEPAALEVRGRDAPAFEGPDDLRALLLSPPGDVTGPLYALGFDPDARPGDRNGIGCDPGAWGDVPAGAIVLAQPGPCRARQIVDNAQATGAAALLSANPAWGPGQVRRPTLIEPTGLTIPAVGVSRDAGLALAEAAADGRQAHLRVTTRTTMRPSDNVLAETPGGDPDHVVMLGAHLDSVIDGPGMNDNGSGVATVLEIARRLALATDGQPGWKVRVAFWTAEEVGLWGSIAYVDELPPADRERIAAYLNFDMLATPGGPRQVYDAAGATSRASETIEQLFRKALETDDLTYELVDVGGASDHYRFDAVGIPVGGVGSEAGFDDRCYHLACDTTEAVDPVLLEQLSRAAAWVSGYLASGEAELEP